MYVIYRVNYVCTTLILQQLLYGGYIYPISFIIRRFYIEYKTLKTVVVSAAEVETGGSFHNLQRIKHLRNMLISLYHSQSATTVKTHNFTAASFVKETILGRYSPETFL